MYCFCGGVASFNVFCVLVTLSPRTQAQRGVLSGTRYRDRTLLCCRRHHQSKPSKPLLPKSRWTPPPPPLPPPLLLPVLPMQPQHVAPSYDGSLPLARRPCIVAPAPKRRHPWRLITLFYDTIDKYDSWFHGACVNLEGKRRVVATKSEWKCARCDE
jgi:hypothetical protein